VSHLDRVARPPQRVALGAQREGMPGTVSQRKRTLSDSEGGAEGIVRGRSPGFICG
jgi:hypothetical protein